METFSQTYTSASGYLLNLLLNASNKSLNMANFSKSTDYFIFFFLLIESTRTLVNTKNLCFQTDLILCLYFWKFCKAHQSEYSLPDPKKKKEKKQGKKKTLCNMHQMVSEQTVGVLSETETFMRKTTL